MNDNSLLNDKADGTAPSNAENPPDPQPPHEETKPLGSVNGAQLWLNEMGGDLFDVAATKQPAHRGLGQTRIGT